MTDNEINNMRMLEESSWLDLIILKIQIGQEAYIKRGSFKGNIVKICSLLSKKELE